jgi:hypothetical protein
MVHLATRRAGRRARGVRRRAPSTSCPQLGGTPHLDHPPLVGWYTPTSAGSYSPHLWRKVLLSLLPPPSWVVHRTLITPPSDLTRPPPA